MARRYNKRDYDNTFVKRFMGDPYCKKCGSELRWCRLFTGGFIPCDVEPVLYAPGKGKQWLVSAQFEGEIIKDALIYKSGMIERGAVERSELRKGYLPHYFNCVK